MKSPNDEHEIYFELAGEIPFGPCYFRMVIDNKQIENKYFGDSIIWSNDSRYCACQQWATTDREGPNTRACIIDLDLFLISELKIVVNGWATMFVFDGSTFRYSRKETYSTVEVEIDLSQVNNWRPLYRHV